MSVAFTCPWWYSGLIDIVGKSNVGFGVIVTALLVKFALGLIRQVDTCLYCTNFAVSFFLILVTVVNEPSFVV